MYRCSECGASADLVNDELFRTCDHADAAVTADISSTLAGAGGIA